MPPTKQKRNRIIAFIGFVLGLGLAFGYLATIPPATEREFQAACRSLGSRSSVSLLSGEVSSSKATAGPSPLPQKAPTLTFRSVDGQPTQLSQYKGKFVLLNFFATWCETCKQEKPSLERLAIKQLARGVDSGVEVISVASDAQWQKAKSFFPEATKVRVWVDPPTSGEDKGSAAKTFGITGYPESFLIDPQGNIRAYFIGKRDWDSGVFDTCLRGYQQGIVS